MITRFIPKHFSVVIVYFLFNLGMNLSASIHALWFDANNKTENFAIYFSVMAATGLLAAFIGTILNRSNIKTPLMIGSLLYGLGLATRCFASPVYIIIISAIIAGIGANIVLLVGKNILYNIPNEELRARRYADIGLTGGITTYFGTLAGTYWVHDCSAPAINYISVLLAASFFGTISFVPYLFNSEDDTVLSEKDPITFNLKFFSDIYNEHKNVFHFVICYGFISSILLNLFMRYLPIIIHDYGYTIHLSGIILANSRLTGSLMQGFLSRTKFTSSLKSGFTLTNTMLITSLLGIANSHHNDYLFICSLVLFFISLSTSGYYDKMIEMKIFPNNEASTLFGISQTLSLLGQMIGISLGGFLFQHTSTGTIFYISAIGVLLILLYSLKLLKSFNLS